MRCWDVHDVCGKRSSALGIAAHYWVPGAAARSSVRYGQLHYMVLSQHRRKVALMAGCAGCGACCAHCGVSCGSFGGGGFAGGFGGGMVGMPFAGLGGFGFRPFSSSRNETPDDSENAVDTDALTDPGHPGHRDAIKTISHVGDEKHGKITAWIESEIHKLNGTAAE